jgi:hypothetical protein
MISIKTNGNALDLPADFSIEIEDTNPIYNDQGSQSVPATVATSRNNERLLGFATRLDIANSPNEPDRVCTVADGAYNRRGLLNITEANKADGITFNIGFDNATAYETWRAKTLAELSSLPVIDVAGDEQHDDDVMLQYLDNLYKNADPQTDPLAIFPIVVNNDSVDTTDDDNTTTVYYWEILNIPSTSGRYAFDPPRVVKRIIDNEITEVSVPEFYGVTPFVRVWRVLELIFEDLGMTIESNPFKDDIQLARLVVLNNAADSCVLGNYIRFEELMPDVTIEEFLNALWVRFGLVYNVDFNTGVAKIELIRDILQKKSDGELKKYLSDEFTVNYETPQYLKLSAKTSFDGAEPSNERFEDFAKRYRISEIRVGTNIEGWTLSDSDRYWTNDDDFDETDNGDGQDGNDSNEDGRDDQDGGDDRDDDDYDNYSAYSRAASRAASVSADNDTENERFLAFEVRTCRWYKIDYTNKKIKSSSTSFFNWDPQTVGLEVVELTSEDECVPIDRVSLPWAEFNDFAPLYLAGSRHYHTYIKGTDDDDDTDGDETPLAFMFAFTGCNDKISGTIGRISPEYEQGKNVTFPDGSEHTLSLLFQFKNGLFANFWTEYDEILRHSPRTVEAPMRIDKTELLKLEMFTPVMLKGVRCLIDKLNYDLPAGRYVQTTATLRPIMPLGTYDIAAEQGIADFSAAARRLYWAYVSDNLTAVLNSQMTASRAIGAWLTETEDYQAPDRYTEPGEAVLASYECTGLTWETDPANKADAYWSGAQRIKKYTCLAKYDIFEVSTYDDGTKVTGNNLGTIEIEIEYSVNLVGKWAQL